MGCPEIHFLDEEVDDKEEEHIFMLFLISENTIAIALLLHTLLKIIETIIRFNCSFVLLSITILCKTM